jgi:hypothetical protein
LTHLKSSLGIYQLVNPAKRPGSLYNGNFDGPGKVPICLYFTEKSDFCIEAALFAEMLTGCDG